MRVSLGLWLESGLWIPNPCDRKNLGGDGRRVSVENTKKQSSRCSMNQPFLEMRRFSESDRRPGRCRWAAPLRAHPRALWERCRVSAGRPPNRWISRLRQTSAAPRCHRSSWDQSPTASITEPQPASRDLGDLFMVVPPPAFQVAIRSHSTGVIRASTHALERA